MAANFPVSEAFRYIEKRIFKSKYSQKFHPAGLILLEKGKNKCKVLLLRHNLEQILQHCLTLGCGWQRFQCEDAGAELSISVWELTVAAVRCWEKTALSSLFLLWQGLPYTDESGRVSLLVNICLSFTAGKSEPWGKETAASSVPKVPNPNPTSHRHPWGDSAGGNVCRERKTLISRFLFNSNTETNRWKEHLVL